MKKNLCKIFIVIFIAVIFIVIEHAHANINELPLLGRIIFVDPGHGGRDPGTSYGNLLEKDIVLEISKVLREDLLSKGAIVYMTRETDTDLSSQWDAKKKRGDLYRRILMYRKYNAELYLSIHINYYRKPSWSGAEILYNPINPENKVFGELLMNKFKTELGSKRRLKTTDLYMYKNTTVPGILIECGFISNANERYLMQTEEYQKKIAKVITSSVVEYFK